MYERWSEGDFRASADLLDTHVLLVLHPEFPEAGTYLGNEAVAAYTRDLLKTNRHLTQEAEETHRGRRQRGRGCATTRCREGQRRSDGDAFLHALDLAWRQGDPY